DRRQVLAAQGLELVVHRQQPLLSGGHLVAEQILGHVAAPTGTSRLSAVRLALSSKRGSSPVPARSIPKVRPPRPLARRLCSDSCRPSHSSSCQSGLSSTRSVISSRTPSRVITVWNSSTSGNSRTIASIARG